MRRPRSRPSTDPSSGPRQRAFGERFDETKTKSRPVGNDIPAGWLSRLLTIACDLPIEDGPEAVTRSLVESLESVLPSYAFGLSMRETMSTEHALAGKVVRTVREGATLDVGPCPERLFPEFCHERVLDMTGEHEGIRLHIASDNEASLRDGTPVLLFLARVADVLASALRTTRLVSSKGRESLELKGQIIQTEKLASLGQIAAGVVHELNNPLTSIVGYSEYLRAKAEKNHGDPNDIERLRRIGDAAGRILRFARDLIAYARPS
ncbi:MAG TPA: histidine kinase dimerization/phospho-acceptor domain-containing protein, partial [Polyangiaceae bacterium]|nr:histidine kinase dimerization/phospho-acceptor domain-containing protein [Polyangiaceae bacterium]